MGRDAYLSTQDGAPPTMRSDTVRDVGLAVNFPGWSVRFGMPPWDEGTTPVRATCVGPETPDSPCDTWELEAAGCGEVAQGVRQGPNGGPRELLHALQAHGAHAGALGGDSPSRASAFAADHRARIGVAVLAPTGVEYPLGARGVCGPSF